MGLGDIDQRWKHLVAAGGSIAEKMVAILKQAALDIDELVGSDSHPVHLSIVQKLEQASGLAASAPVFNQPSASAPPDPTTAGSPADNEADSSPEPTSITSSSGSEEGSTS